MHDPNLSHGPAVEKRQLLFLAMGLSVIGGGLWWLLGRRAPGVVLLILGGLALSGVLAYGAIGRGVFLIFSVLSLAIGRAVSWVIVLVLYAVMIAGLGSVLRLFGMNRLERNFERCRKKRSMLVDVLPLDRAGFRRQS